MTSRLRPVSCQKQTPSCLSRIVYSLTNSIQKTNNIVSIYFHSDTLDQIMSDRKRTTTPSAYAPVRIGLGTAMLYGFTGGLAGVAAMTVSEKIEQMGTGRPNSYVPGKTLRALLGDRKPVSGSDMVLYNHAFHWGNGAVIGIIRGVMSYYGIVGPFANFMFTGIRLLIDQTLENLTGVGE